MTTTPLQPTEAIGPEEGGGPPLGQPWTLVVAGEDWSADLEHGAPLPRIGERIDFIGDDGTQHRFRVLDVVHTVQSAPSERPPVRAEQAGPNSTVTDAGDRQPRALRAGLPQVVVRRED